MDFRILGPVEVWSDNDVLPLEGLKQRTTLGALLTVANDVAPMSRLIDWLWGRRPPRSAAALVQTQVSRLRRALEPARQPWSQSELILRRPPGYVLRIDPDQLDALRLQQLVDAGRLALEQGHAESASDLLATAIGLWRGGALADLAFVDAAQADIVRLEALRMAAISTRIDADLTLGRHAVVLPELEALVQDHPLDERLCAQLMIALCRNGRQADSLLVYGRVRARLARELRIEPSPASQRLAAAIMAQDPALDDKLPWSFANW